MKVSIVEVETGNQTVRVLFAARVGFGRACWVHSAPPTIGHNYDVECDIDLPLDLDHNARRNEARECGVSSQDGTTTFKGRIEAHDDDGLCYLRLGDDCLIMVESVQEGLAGEWLTICVPIELVRLTPFGF